VLVCALFESFVKLCKSLDNEPVEEYDNDGWNDERDHCIQNTENANNFVMEGNRSVGLLVRASSISAVGIISFDPRSFLPGREK